MATLAPIPTTPPPPALDQGLLDRLVNALTGNFPGAEALIGGPWGAVSGVLGSRAIAPLVSAQRLRTFSGRPTSAKVPLSLDRPGSEGFAKIMDFDPAMGLARATGETAQEIGSYIGQPKLASEEIAAAQRIIQRLSQRDLPETLTIFRGGVLPTPVPWARPVSNRAGMLHPETPVPATTRLNIAEYFGTPTTRSLETPSVIMEATIPREQVLADVSKLQRGRGYSEEAELLVPAKAFEHAQLRLPYNPGGAAHVPGMLSFIAEHGNLIISLP